MMEKHRKEIVDQLGLIRNPHHIAQRVGVKVSEVRKVMKEMDLEYLPGWGRVSLQPHLISRRKSGHEHWSRDDQQILLQNRMQHDQGSVTMCQGRDGEYILQYAIPTKRKVIRNPYFTGG